MGFVVDILRRMGLLLAFCLLWVGIAGAQVSRTGRMTGPSTLSLSESATMILPGVDVRALEWEDLREAEEGLPYRFGVSYEVAHSMDNSGVWTALADGVRLWRLKIVCQKAKSVNLIFNRFLLPKGAELYIYDETAEYVLGAFSSQNNKEHGKFATAPVPGESCVLEYYEPSDVSFPGEILVGLIVHGYRDVFAIAKDALDYGDSGPCNINVGCPEGADWGNEKRSVAMIITDLGKRLCTGALINNARMDLTPYFLTADHCLGGEETWVVMFGYESVGCEDIDGPLTNSISGATLVANDEYTDFGLLRLMEDPPDSYGVYYSGWSALDAPPDSSVCIHHPSGDTKKISFDYDPLVPAAFLDIAEDDTSHFKAGAWELGTTEGGSSGAPLFDYDHRIVGQLHGGWAACGNASPDWFGRFSLSWDLRADSSKRLSDWLDPDSVGLVGLDGRDGVGVTIYHNPIIRTGDTVNDYAITAIIVSNCGLDAGCLTLSYDVDGVPGSSVMVGTGQANEYRGKIPAQQSGSTISYSISACDTCGQGVSSDTFVLSVFRPMCGDITGNGQISLSDIAFLIDHIYISKDPLKYPEAANVDGSVDGLLTLADITYLVDFLYRGGAAPVCGD